LNLAIVDSGIGGLSVFALADAMFRREDSYAVSSLTFANASPEDNYGYNSMPTRVERIETFDRFLNRIFDRVKPDLMYLACNTLAVILPETDFFKAKRCPILDIVSTGVNHLCEELHTEGHPVALFATPTTVQEGRIEKALIASGINSNRLVSIACPGLADSIAADPSGQMTEKILCEIVQSESRLHKGNLFAYLGCTHYGYRSEMFARVLRKFDLNPKILNPNAFAVEDLRAWLASHLSNASKGDPELSILYRYRLPEDTKKALESYLKTLSPAALVALRNYNYCPDLF